MKRAEKHLLEALYGHISSLGKFESDTLMEEDPDVMQRRAATKKVCSHTHTQAHCFSADLTTEHSILRPNSLLTADAQLLHHCFDPIA